MSTDTRAIVAVNVALGGLLSVQLAGVNTRIDDVNTRIDDLRTELTGRIDDLRTELTGRIDAVVVEITTVKVDLAADNADIRNDLRRMDDRPASRRDRLRQGRPAPRDPGTAPPARTRARRLTARSAATARPGARDLTWRQRRTMISSGKRRNP